MAKFVKVPSSDGRQDYFINADRVRYVKGDFKDSGKCHLYFGDDHSLIIGVGHAVFVDMVESGQKH